MKRAVIAATLAALVSGCTTDGQLIRRKLPNACPGGGTGVSYTPVTYGDSHLVVFSLTDVAPGSEWLFQLLPKDDFRNARVSIRAKSGGPAWLAAEGRRSEGALLRICIPESAPVGAAYDYLVEVENVGILDPHVRVVRR